MDRYITTNWAGASATSERVRGLEVTGAENFRTDHSYSATDSPFTPASGPHSSNIDDGVLAYACAVLSDGMFMLKFRDAIREGDGERAIRLDCHDTLFQGCSAGEVCSGGFPSPCSD